jgi:hypothetical protein
MEMTACANRPASRKLRRLSSDCTPYDAHQSIALFAENEETLQVPEARSLCHPRHAPQRGNRD